MGEEEIEVTPKVKKSKGKVTKSSKNYVSERGSDDIPKKQLPQLIKPKAKGKGKVSKKMGVLIVEPKDEAPLELQPKSKGKKKKETKKETEAPIDTPQPQQSSLSQGPKTSKGKKVKIVEENDPVPDVLPKLNKKSQKKSAPPPPALVPQNKKAGVKRKAPEAETVKQPAAKKGR